MDSQDSSGAAPPPQPHHHQQQHHRPAQNIILGPPQQHVQQQPPSHPNSFPFQQQQSRFPFNSMVTSAPHQLSMDFPESGGGDTLSQNGGGVTSGFGIDSSNKKKRGRPRKIHPDVAGNNISLGLSPTPVMNSGGGSAAGADTFSSEPPAKKHRGRPPGSGKKQQLDAPGTIGIGFTPHVILVKAGEDISAKVMAFSQEGPRTVCILSANGSICSVTIRQPGSGGTVTYEGKFEILKLSGSFLVSDNNGTRVRSGSLSVSLVGTDGRILGGVVAGVLKAATSVQIIVGSFIQDEKKPRPSSTMSAAAISTAPPLSNILTFGNNVVATDDTTPPSQGGSNDASDDDGDDEDGGSPADEGGAYANNSGEPPMQNVQMYSNMGWANSPMKMHHQHPN